MIKREFKALIVEDFRNQWLLTTAIDENSMIEDVTYSYDSPELVKLGKRISGNIVTLTENTYPIGETDYFEKEDNNFVMHKSLWIEI